VGQDQRGLNTNRPTIPERRGSGAGSERIEYLNTKRPTIPERRGSGTGSERIEY